jgi:hypothetical protein
MANGFSGPQKKKWRRKFRENFFKKKNGVLMGGSFEWDNM